jgi:isopenicillin N synthase-like dioxygenase
MGYAQARASSKDSIPVIDITPLRDGSDSIGVAEQLHAASQNLGFIYVRGHGIPRNLIDAARRHAFEFFRCSAEEKRDVLISAGHRGWLKPGASKMQDGVPADLKESFIWGIERAQAPDDHPLRGPNQWPQQVPALQAHALDYFHHAQSVARHLMRGFALGLNLPEQFFLQTCEAPLSRASFVYYPAQPPTMGEQQFGVAPHTDFGVLTVLCQDDTGGLQVQDVNGEWIHAPPIEDTLVVNVGDLLSRWTDGEYKSTPHRVVNSSGRERLSLVLAFDPDPQTMIDANAVFAGRTAKEEPITCGDYLVWRFGKAFSYRKQSDQPQSTEG